MSQKDKSSANKIYCDDCRTQIPKSLWAKHQFCQRHLRAKAAGLFYKKRKGKALADEARKKMREDPETMLNDPRFQGTSEALGFEPAEVRKADLITTRDRVRGVWVLLQDFDTGANYYKNRLSGKIQRNRPIGLRDEDVEVETIATAGGREAQRQEVDRNSSEGEECMPGEWQDVALTQRFGGSDNEEDDPTVKPFFEAQSSPSQPSEIDESEENHSLIEPEIPDKTAYFRANEEKEIITESIIEKPVYHEVAKTVSAVFSKRTKKSAVEL